MSMTLRAAAAAVALALTGTANAAFTCTDCIKSDQGQTGDGELFINIYRNTSNPGTIVLDTNVSALDLNSGAVTSWTSNAVQTQAVLDFLSTAPLSDFLFDAGARQNSPDVAEFGMYLTNTDPTLLPPDAKNNLAAFYNYQTNMETWIDSVNQGNGNSTPDGMLIPAAAGQQGDWNDGFRGWKGNGDTLGWNQTTDTVVTNDLTLYRYHYDPSTLASLTTDMGLLSIDSATGQVSYSNASVSPSPVPVPAAVWLFGSGLVGMVSVARRRRAA